MADLLECVGGPLDGHRITCPPGKYAWVRGYFSTLWSTSGKSGLRLLPGKRAVVACGGAASSKPRDGAALYEHDHGSGVMFYAGHRKTLCEFCGTYHPKCEGGRERRRCALGGQDA